MIREDKSTCFENSELTVKLSIMCVFMLSLLMFRFLFRERKLGVKIDLNIDRNRPAQEKLKIDPESIKKQNSSDDFSQTHIFENNSEEQSHQMENEGKFSFLRLILAF